MKHIDFTNIGLGMELSPSFSKQLQEGLLERLSAMLKGLTNNATGVVILEGCVMTKVGDQYDQTAGVVYYNGQILTVDVFSGNHATQVPVYQAATNTFTQQAWYGDAALRDTFYNRKLPMAMAAAGSGIADYDEVVRIEDIKANRALEAWNDLVLTAPWVEQSGDTQYRKDSLGRVHLRGKLWTNSTVLGSGTLKIGQLPLGYRPIQEHLFAVEYFDGTSRIINSVRVETDGEIFFSNHNSAPATGVHLDCISFYTD